MMINERECVLVRDAANLPALCEALAAEGYRSCANKSLADVLLNTNYMSQINPMGVRWQPDDEFPNCLAFCPLEIYEDLADSGMVFNESYSNDHGVTYAVRWFDDKQVEVGDLL